MRVTVNVHVILNGDVYEVGETADEEDFGPYRADFLRDKIIEYVKQTAKTKSGDVDGER